MLFIFAVVAVLGIWLIGGSINWAGLTSIGLEHIGWFAGVALGLIAWALWVNHDSKSYEDWKSRQRPYQTHHYGGVSRHDSAVRRSTSRRQWLANLRRDKFYREHGEP